MFSKGKRILALTLALVLAFVLAACGGAAASSQAPATGASQQPAAEGDVFKIGNFYPLSGPVAAFGIEGRNSIEMAIEMINEEGGFNGVPVEYVVYDCQSPTDAVSIVNRMIEDDEINALVTSMMSSEILVIGELVNNNKIVTLSGGTSPTYMKEGWEYMFRPAMNTDVAMVLNAEMAKEVGVKRVALFNAQDDSSVASADAFADECKSRGIEVVAHEGHAPGDTDFSAQIANIIGSNPDAVFFACMGDASINFVKQLRQLGYKGIVMDNEAFADYMIDVVGVESSDYIMFTNPYVTYRDAEDAKDIPTMYNFLKLYEARWGELPATEISYQAWDCITSLWEAAKLAGSNDSESLLAAMNKLSFDGLGGRLDFTSGTGEGYETFNRFVLVDGKNVLFDTWLAEGGLEAFKESTGIEF